MSKSKKEQDQLFVSLSKEEFDRLPRPSTEDLQRALDEGRPSYPFGATDNAAQIDSKMRFL